METKKNNELGRKLGLGAVIALGVGTTVGSGIFSSLSEVANASGSMLFLFLAFLSRRSKIVKDSGGAA